MDSVAPIFENLFLDKAENFRSLWCATSESGPFPTYSFQLHTALEFTREHFDCQTIILSIFSSQKHWVNEALSSHLVCDDQFFLNTTLKRIKSSKIMDFVGNISSNAEISALLSGFGVKSKGYFCCIPLCVDGEFIGSLSLVGERERKFSARDKSLIELVAKSVEEAFSDVLQQTKAEKASKSDIAPEEAFLKSSFKVQVEVSSQDEGKDEEFHLVDTQNGDSASERIKDIFDTVFEGDYHEWSMRRFHEVIESNQSCVFEQCINVSKREFWFEITVCPFGAAKVEVCFVPLSSKARRERAISDLQDLSTNPPVSSDEYIRRLLAIGRRTLGTQSAILSEIDGDHMVLHEIDCILPCEPVRRRISIQDTFFEEFIKGKDMHVTRNLGKPVKHPDLQTKPVTVGAFAAVPLVRGSQVFGVLSFLSPHPRERDFEKFEIGILTVIGHLVSKQMTLDAAHAELIANRDELQMIFDHVPTQIWRIDKNHKYLKVNRSAAEYFGTTQEEIVGKTLADFDPKHADYCFEMDRRVMQTGEPILGLEVLRDHKHQSWERLDILPVEGDQRVAEDGLLIIATDISAQKKAELDLARVISELETANRSLEQFVTVVSHDLKAPLRHIRMIADLMKKKAESSEDLGEYIDIIRQNALNGKNMVDALLTLSRVTKGQLKLVSFNLKDIVESVITVLDHDLAQAGGEIFYDKLPTINADQSMMRNLLQNLLINAIRYRLDDPLHIHISAESMDGFHVISVCDNGRGISSKHSEEIFQPFTRIPDLKSHQTIEGEGVGLSICKQIVERHGGRIWLDTDYTDGACFKFTLPQ